MLYRITAIVDIKEEDPLMAEEIVYNALSVHGWLPAMVSASAITDVGTIRRLQGRVNDE